MPTKVKKVKKLRVRKVRQVRARRQPATKKPPVTNVNIHFAAGSQHAAGSTVYIPNAGENQVIPYQSVPKIQASIPVTPTVYEIETQTSVPVKNSSSQTEKPQLTTSSSQYEPEIHALYEEKKVDDTQNPMRVNPLLSNLVSPVLGNPVSPVKTPLTRGGGGRAVPPVEPKNFISINRSAVREASRINRESEKNYDTVTPMKAPRVFNAPRQYLSLQHLQDVAFGHGIDSVDTNKKTRTRAQLQAMIKEATK